MKNHKISFATPFYRQKSITTEYNELTLSLGKGWTVVFRAFDEGWYESKKGDIMNPIPEIRLPELIQYANSKGVDIVLWTVFNVLDEHLDEAMEKYKSMGVKGFKIDFLDRDDQEAVELAYRIAEAALKYQMVLDYHGYYKPTGMSRTFPNILNYEGVFGMEESRWTELSNDMPLYDVTFPYIRMMAGRVDFTPGAMRNGTKDNWKAIYTAPVSMGTRCHQLACYIVHDSPFTMLCDDPTNYEREQECVDMITSLPTVFDRTVIPQGEMGKYIVTAREKDGNWYVAGQTNWDKRKITLKFDFLEKGKTYIEKPFSMSYLEACCQNIMHVGRLLREKYSTTPSEPISEIASTSVDKDFLERMQRIIEGNFSNPDLNVNFLANKLCISRSRLFAKIKTLADVSPNEMIQIVRLKKAAQMLSEGNMKVSEVCYTVGFSNPSYFSKCFYKQFGVSPSEIRK